MALLEILLNAFVVFLLAVTTFYCHLLNKRIRQLQDGKSELAALLKHFDVSTSRATDSIAELQTTSRKISELIQSRMDKAGHAADDLTLLIEHAGKLSSTLEAEINIGRTVGKINHDHDRPVSPTRSPKAEERNVIQEALQQAKGDEANAMRAEASSRQIERIKKEKGNSNAISSLQTMLEKMANRANSEPKREAPEPERRMTAEKHSRSKAEQELLDIIRASKV